MRSPFQSARLLYRAIEPSDASFMRDIVSDASSALSRVHLKSNSASLGPASKKSIAALQDFLSEKALVAVIICLPVPHSPPFSTFNKAKPDPSEIQEHLPTPIGCLFITRLHLGQGSSGNARLGIDLIPQYQGKGYGIESVSWILNWSFQIAGLHRVGVECFEWNYSARGLFEKLGFVSEGRKREALWFDGRWWDTFEYGILEHEWRKKGGVVKLV